MTALPSPPASPNLTRNEDPFGPIVTLALEAQTYRFRWVSPGTFRGCGIGDCRGFAADPRRRSASGPLAVREVRRRGPSLPDSRLFAKPRQSPIPQPLRHPPPNCPPRGSQGGTGAWRGLATRVDALRETVAPPTAPVVLGPARTPVLIWRVLFFCVLFGMIALLSGGLRHRSERSAAAMPAP